MRTRLLVAAGAAATLMFGVATPASAATSGTSTATITITGGALEITVPTVSAHLGTAMNTIGGVTVSGLLGVIQVTDARSAAAGSGWVTSVVSTPFTQLPSGATIAASTVNYSAGAINKVGTAFYRDDDPSDLSGISAAVTATDIAGDNIATWNPTLSVVVPGGTPVGDYAATITHSVL